MSMPLSSVIVVRQIAERELSSALPSAPVVPHRVKRRSAPPLRRTRTATASVLVRAARRIAPA
jgi:hypothetical protein